MRFEGDDVLENAAGDLSLIDKKQMLFQPDYRRLFTLFLCRCALVRYSFLTASQIQQAVTKERRRRDEEG
jgi:hypothetical protein